MEIRELLKQCTVSLSVAGHRTGTGFFVAPGLIITCAHVVEWAFKQKLPVEVHLWNNQFIGQASLQQFLLEQIPVKDAVNVRDNLYPDLALLQIDMVQHPEYPYVYLDDRVTYDDKLYSYGYIMLYQSGDEARFVYDGKSWIDDQKPLLKFKDGQAAPGLSGAPVLNFRTGAVCGVVQSSKPDSNMGGRAIPTTIVFQAFPELAPGQTFQPNQRWLASLTSQQRRELEQSVAERKANPVMLQPLPYIEKFMHNQAHGETERVHIFISAAPKDKVPKENLLMQLEQFVDQGIISLWKGNYSLGISKDLQIENNLNVARIFLPLVTADYLANTDCKRELEKARSRAAAEMCIIVPILIRSCIWDVAFSGMPILPDNEVPVTEWEKPDQGYTKVVQDIRKLVDRLKEQAS